MRSIPSRTLHRPLLTWKAYCLAQSGRNVLAEMNKVLRCPGAWRLSAAPPAPGAPRIPCNCGILAPDGSDVPLLRLLCPRVLLPQVKEYIVEYQGHAWAVLSHHSSARYDQLASLQKAYATVDKQPWNKVRAAGVTGVFQPSNQVRPGAGWWGPTHAHGNWT
jgi:hypothetical protein